MCNHNGICAHYLSLLQTCIRQIIQGQRGVYRMVLQVPDRIHSRWREHAKLDSSRRRVVKYTVSAALKMMNVTSQEFAKCWEFITKNASHDELFYLLKDAGFGSSILVTSAKLDFVRKVIQRYNDAKVFFVTIFQSYIFLLH